jgi:hypothetical protein
MEQPGPADLRAQHPAKPVQVEACHQRIVQGTGGVDDATKRWHILRDVMHGVGELPLVRDVGS